MTAIEVCITEQCGRVLQKGAIVTFSEAVAGWGVRRGELVFHPVVLEETLEVMVDKLCAAVTSKVFWAEIGKVCDRVVETTPGFESVTLRF